MKIEVFDYVPHDARDLQRLVRHVLPEEPTKQSPAEATCLSLVSRLRAMKKERDDELAAKLEALEQRDNVAEDRDRWRRRFYNLLVAFLIVGAIGIGACIAEASHVVR